MQSRRRTALLHIDNAVSELQASACILMYGCDHYSAVIIVNYCILPVSFLFYCRSKKLQQQYSWSYDVLRIVNKAFQNAPKCTILKAKVQKFSGERAQPLMGRDTPPHIQSLSWPAATRPGTPRSKNLTRTSACHRMSFLSI